MIPFKLEHVIERLIAPPDAIARQRTLRQLTGVRLSADEAERAWERIMDHKWYMGERLRRDVGLRVAAMDYFENIAPPAPKRIRRSSNSLPARLPMMQSLAR